MTSAVFDVGAIDNAEQLPVALEAKGAAVVRVQILLDRAHFSCGQIDGSFGSNLQKTVAAFQEQRHLPETGSVDDATWAALNADTAPAVTYTITAADENGPFIAVPKDLMQAAKLPFLGYASPLDELAEHFHAAPGLLKQMNPEADFTRAGQVLKAPDAIVLPPSAAAGQVVVSKSDSAVPLGERKIKGQKKNPTFEYNASLFWDAPNATDRATIPAGPRNSVGSVWIDLSKDHYGIHGTPDPSSIGHAESDGCIRLTNWDALDLASTLKPGTPVLLKE